VYDAAAAGGGGGGGDVKAGRVDVWGHRRCCSALLCSAQGMVYN